jgi:hypothetical protein
MLIYYLVLAAKRDPWLSIQEKGIDETWRKRLLPGNSLLYLYGDYSLGESNSNRDFYLDPEKERRIVREIQEPIAIDDSEIFFKTYTGWDSLLHKTVSCLSYLLENSDAEYFLRSAVSTFWNPTATEKLLKQIEQNHGSRFIAGSKKKLLSHEYVEGSSLIISRSAAQEIVENVAMLNFEIIDDVAIGMLAKSLSIQMLDFPRPRLESTWDFFDTRFGKLEDIYSFRCKTQKKYDKGKMPHDAKIMKRLHTILLKTNNY